MLRPPPVLSRRPGKLDELGEVETHLALNDFEERDVRGIQVCDVREQRLANACSTTVQFANTSRNEIYQDVGVEDLLQSVFDEGSIHVVR